MLAPGTSEERLTLSPTINVTINNDPRYKFIFMLTHLTATTAVM